MGNFTKLEIIDLFNEQKKEITQLKEKVNILQDMLNLKTEEEDGWLTIQNFTPPPGSLVKTRKKGDIFMESDSEGNLRVSRARETGFKILASPERFKSFLNGELELPIDSDKHEWRDIRKGEYPKGGLTIVLMIDDGSIIKGRCAHTAVPDMGNIRIQIGLQKHEFELNSVLRWRYC